MGKQLDEYYKRRDTLWNCITGHCDPENGILPSVEMNLISTDDLEKIHNAVCTSTQCICRQ